MYSKSKKRGPTITNKITMYNKYDKKNCRFNFYFLNSQIYSIKV